MNFIACHLFIRALWKQAVETSRLLIRLHGALVIKFNMHLVRNLLEFSKKRDTVQSSVSEKMKTTAISPICDF